MNGSWEIFISEVTPTSLGSGVRFHYNPSINKLRYRDPKTAQWIDVPDIDLSPYLTKDDAAQIYLTKNSAENIYLTINEAGDVYLSKSEASTTYLTAQSADELFLTQEQADDIYISITEAVSTFSPQVSPNFSGEVSLPFTTSIGNVSSEEISFLSGLADPVQEQLERKTQYTTIETSEDVDAYKDYQILADTTDGSITVTLDPEPVIGDTVYIVDTKEMALKKPIFVSGNGNNVHGKDKLFGINVAGSTLVFMFVGGTMGWKVI